MNLSKFSKDRAWNSLVFANIDPEYANPIFNYLIFGLPPGSFFTAILANDYHNAIMSSHPNNSISALKTLSWWIVNRMPDEAHGNYDKVTAWIVLDAGSRRHILENHSIIYKPEEETWLALKEGYHND